MKEKKAVQQAFGKNSVGYITSSTHAQGPDLDMLVEWLEPSKDMKILDIATGGGHVAKRLAPKVAHVFATDLTKTMLDQTAEFLYDFKNIDYIIADAEQLPFLDATFDVVTCRVAAHHFPRPQHFIAEVARVLKPGGKFMFIDNIAPDAEHLDIFINKLEKARDYSHVHEYTISEWKTMMAKNDLQLVQEHSWKKKLQFDEWVDRMIDDPTERDVIENMLLKADIELREYFLMDIEANHVTSFSIDTWNVLYTKRV